MSEQHLSDKTFSEFDLPEPLLRGVQEAGFEFCTPIQAEALPIALAGQDVAGQAQTGTGKSAAFLLASFNYLLKHPAVEGRKPTQPRAMMLAPTRELAIQIHKDAEVLGKYTGLKLGLVYGGTGYESQRKMLEAGVDVLIGTPGRIIDYFKQGIFDLKAAQVMVMDEADRMFDLGFIKDIRYLIGHMPPPQERLSMLFSATLSHRVNELAYVHMNEPVAVNVVSDKKTADKVTQTVYHTANDEKIPLLVGLLRHMDPHRTLVFTNTKHMAERMQSWLEANGLHAAVISGDVPQNKRQRLLEDFSTGKLPVLVATDVAARGLHIPEVSHVFNFDLPQDAEDYVHRIGRTARAGASGDAISFACETHAYSLIDIEKFIEHKIAVGKVTAELLPKLERPGRRPRKPREGDRGQGRAGGGTRSESGRQDAGPPRQEKQARADTPKAEPRQEQQDRARADTPKAEPLQEQQDRARADTPKAEPRQEQQDRARPDTPMTHSFRSRKPQRPAVG